jgi:release factor glutamine methyltransferase
VNELRTPVTWAELWSEVEEALREAGLPSARAEARWLVEEVSGIAAGDLGGRPATARGAGRLSQMVERRMAGEPLQYIIGHWPFRQLDLILDERVLIPRPETEIVAEVALAEAKRAGTTACVVADLGTGSGAIALALADELPEAEIWASDSSPDALDLASANLAGLGMAATRVRLVEGVWYEALPEALRGRLRVVVSNPPYVAEAEYEELSAEIRRHEPKEALVPGPTGTEALELLVDGGLAWLEPGGALVLELAPHQASAVAGRAERTGYQEVAVQPDLAGLPRVLVARRP